MTVNENPDARLWSGQWDDVNVMDLEPGDALIMPDFDLTLGNPMYGINDGVKQSDLEEIVEVKNVPGAEFPSATLFFVSRFNNHRWSRVVPQSLRVMRIWTEVEYAERMDTEDEEA